MPLIFPLKRELSFLRAYSHDRACAARVAAERDMYQSELGTGLSTTDYIDRLDNQDVAF